MAESILVTGKKISSMELVTNVTGNEKIPTGQPDDLAVTPNQIADHTIARGDLASQEDLSQVEVSLGTQITDLANDVTSADDSIRGLIAEEESARIAADNLKVDKQGSVSSVAGRVGNVVLAPSDVLVEGFGSQEDVNKYVPKPFLSGYTYGLGERVVLNDGEVVKSLVDGNVGNPNLDMTGWVSVVSDSLSGTIQTFNTPEAGVDPVTGVADGAYFNVRSSNDESYVDEYQNVSGSAVSTGKSYPSSAAVNLLKYTTGITDPFSGLTQDKINSHSLTPFHFGAIGDGASHKLSERYSTLAEAQTIYPHAVSLDDEIDWCATQALFNFTISHGNELQERVDFSGRFYVNRTVKYVVPQIGVGGQYRTIYGDTTFFVTDDFIGNEVLLIHGRGVNHKGVIRANLRRKVKWGVTLSARGYDPLAVNHISFGNSVDRLFIDNAKIHSVRVLGNAMFAKIEFMRTGGSGVGGNPYGGGTQLKADVSSHTNQNAGGLTSQSTMVVSVLPEATIGESTILATYNGFISRVASIDSATNTIVCKPLLPIATEPMQLSYIYGGAVGTRGSDMAGLQIGQISQIGCGMLLDHTGMYPVTVVNLLSEFAGCVVYNSGLETGVDIKSKYVEGDEYVAVSNNDYYVGGTVSLDWGLNVDPAKLVNITYGRKSDGSDMDFYGGFHGLRLHNKNIDHQWKYGKLPRNVIPNGVANGFGVDFNAPHENRIYKATGNVTIGFMSIDENWNRLFGYDSQEFTIVGNGVNSAPTGTITIPVLSGYTLNGGTTNLTYAGFNAAAHFKFFLNVTAKDIQVSVSGDNTYNLSVGAILPDGTNVNNLSVNTKLWFRAATTATNLPTPTTGTKVDGNISTVFSVAALGLAHNKTQVVEYVSLFEKWERVFTSAIGSYGAWRLLSYETKKGTTAQRPSNPQLGMRYYDTTLLAAGKPIEWNGSNWIDMTGAAV